MINLSIQKKLRSANGVMNLQLNLEIKQRQFLTLYGESGAGKTSVLRMLAGLLKPDKGRIVVGGNVWLDIEKSIDLIPQKRRIGFVFQDYALFPNMTVKENLLFALQQSQNNRIVDELLEVMELGDLQKQKPTLLSGGQQQRVALARALVPQPELLLLDEPLSALDNTIRHKLQDYLLEVHQKYALTTILVSHDISEIVKLSDQLIHLQDGAVVAQGSPKNILLPPEQIQMEGEIIAIAENKLTLRVEQETIDLVLNPTAIVGLNIGDRIAVAAHLLAPSVRKLS